MSANGPKCSDGWIRFRRPAWTAAGDFVDHAFTTVKAAVACVEATSVQISEHVLGVPTGACQELSRQAHRVLASHISPEDAQQLTQPRPKKQTTARFWQAQNDVSDLKTSARRH